MNKINKIHIFVVLIKIIKDWSQEMAKKDVRIIITLECTEAKKEGKPASRYSTKKNKNNTPGRIELMKYNPFLRRHTLHKEIK